MLVAPLVKLIMAGTRPTVCRAKNVTATPAEFGSIYADGAADGHERVRALRPAPARRESACDS